MTTVPNIFQSGARILSQLVNQNFQTLEDAKLDKVITTTGLNKGIVTSQTGTGTLTTFDGPQPNGFNYNYIVIDDQIDGPTDQSYSTQGLSLLMSIHGANNEGTRTVIYSEACLTAPTKSSNANRFCSGGGFVGRAQSNDGGSAGGSSGKGALFGGYSAALVDAGVNAHLANASAWEFNISVPTGSSVDYKTLVQFASLPGDVVQGSFESMISISGNAGSVGWQRGISFNQANGKNPITTTGTLISCDVAGSPTILNGVDLTAYTFSGSSFLSNLFSVSGSGNIHAASYRGTSGSPVILSPDASNQITLQAAEMTLDYFSTTAPADEKRSHWLQSASDGSLTLYAENDAQNAANPMFAFYRSGYVPLTIASFVPFRLPTYTFAALPVLVSGDAGALAVCSNGYGGASGLVKWSGAAWLRTDNGKAPATSGNGYFNVLTGTAAITFGAIASGASNVSTAQPLDITVTGAVLGDAVQCSLNVDAQGCSITGYVISADHVRLVVNNLTGGSITFGAVTGKAYVIKA